MKPLKILLGNNTLSLLAGSETWTYTMALALKALGHDVSCFSPELGIISDKLIEAGIPCYNELYSSSIKPFSFILEEAVDHNYDVIIANHNHIVDYLRSRFPTTPIIATIHGILHKDPKTGALYPEHPSLNAGVNQFVAVSEEIQEKLLNDYGIESTIIRNAFDRKKYVSLRKPNETVKQILVNTNYNGKDDEIISVLREVAKHYGARLSAIGANFSQTFDVTRALEDADVVFGMGRSVLEGLAAGRLAIVHGRWGTGGVICEENANELRTYNFSGRNANGVFATKEEIIAMIDKYYNPVILEWGLEYIAKNHNIVTAAESYLRIARELTGELYSKSEENSAVAPDTRPFRLASNHE